MITEKKLLELRKRMKELGIIEDDLEEKFIRGSGSGGQKRNKTSSSVVLLHKPSGIQIRSESERSQTLNRFIARKELCDRLDSKLNNAILEKDREAAKIRRQKARRSRKTRNKILKDKAFQGDKKLSRQKVKE